MSEIIPLDTDQRGLYTLNAAGHTYPNMESYPGQLNVVPSIRTMAQEVKQNRKAAVKAVRHAERTQEHIRGGIDRKVNMVVGADIRVQAQPDWELLGITKEQAKKLGKEFEQNFRDWAYSPLAHNDTELHFDFGGQMWLAFRHYVGADAETVGLIHFDEDRRAGMNGRWATHLQIVDPQRVGTPYDKIEDKSIFEGRKLDRWGGMVGIFVQDYSDTTLELMSQTFSYYPRQTDDGRPYAFHFFKKSRAGQHRGISPLVTVLKHSSMLDKFDDAQLASAVLNAVFAMYIKSDATPDAMAAQLNPSASGGIDQRLDFYDKVKIKFGQNRLAILPPQDELKIESVNRAAQDTDTFVNQFLRKFAVALDIPFELLAGNYSNANYSSIRAALVDAWRSVRADRALFFRHVPALVYMVVCEEAIARGRVKLPAGAPSFSEFRAAYCRATFVGPPMGWVDPKREAEATKILLDSRVTSHSQEIMERGGDVESVFEDWGTNIELAESNGFDLIPVEPAAMESFGSDTDPDADVDADPHNDIDGPQKPKPKPAPAPAPAKKAEPKKKPKE